MAEIMKCPKCGGSGEFWSDPLPQTAAAGYKTVCPSCGGKGYVTSGEVQPVTIKTTGGFQLLHPLLIFVCPHCGRLIELEVRSGE